MMKKDQQLSMNEFVMQNYNRMMDEFIEKTSYDGVQLRSCKACVYETENFFVLRSYESIVAFIDKFTGQKFDVLRWAYGYTSTSAQHIAKFFADYGDFRVSRYTYRDI